MLDECSVFMKDPEGGGSMGVYNQKNKVFTKKTDFMIEIDCHVSDDNLINHRTGFRITTSDDRCHIVVMSNACMYNWSSFKANVLKEVKTSRISRCHELGRPLIFQKWLDDEMELFNRVECKTRTPIRFIGIQLHLLGMFGQGGHFGVQNFEVFFDPNKGIFDAFGQRKDDPLSVWDPHSFRVYHNLRHDCDLSQFLIHHTETGRDGFLDRLAPPYTTSHTDFSYWEDVNIFLGYLYMINQPALFDMCGFCGLVLVVGDSDRGKTDACMNGNCVSDHSNFLGTGSSKEYIQQKRTYQTCPITVDDNASYKLEEALAMAGSQKFGVGTKTGGEQVAVAAVANTSNLSRMRTARLTTGRLAMLLKEFLSNWRTDDASKDGNGLIEHVKAIRSTEKPLLFVHTMCQNWFNGKLKKFFIQALQRIYDLKPIWSTRSCLVFSHIAMGIEFVQEHALQSRDDSGGADNYPGKYFLDQGGKAAYYKYLAYWLSRIEELSKGPSITLAPSSAEAEIDAAEKNTLQEFLTASIDVLFNKLEMQELTDQDLPTYIKHSSKADEEEKIYLLVDFLRNATSAAPKSLKDDVLKAGGQWRTNKVVPGGAQMKFMSVPIKVIPLRARQICYKLLGIQKDAPLFDGEKDASIEHASFDDGFHSQENSLQQPCMPPPKKSRAASKLPSPAGGCSTTSGPAARGSKLRPLSVSQLFSSPEDKDDNVDDNPFPLHALALADKSQDTMKITTAFQEQLQLGSHVWARGRSTEKYFAARVEKKESNGRWFDNSNNLVHVKKFTETGDSTSREADIDPAMIGRDKRCHLLKFFKLDAHDWDKSRLRKTAFPDEDDLNYKMAISTHNHNLRKRKGSNLD